MGIIDYCEELQYIGVPTLNIDKTIEYSEKL